MRMSAEACAKLNLTLDILGKREDGYHLLRMVMQSVTLCDTVTVWTDNGGGITLQCSQEGVPCDHRNTAYRAAELFFETTGLQNEGIGIKIKKRIPHGAGLGGGSADAAAVLRLLNELFSTCLSDRALCDIGLQVGADVPFCLMGGTMLAEGTGTLLSPLSDLEPCYFVIVKPDISISTADAYRKCDEVTPTRRPDTDKVVDAVLEHDLTALGKQLCNVFEEVIGLPEAEHVKSVMHEAGALGACMSGSGSAVFGMFAEKSAAEDCRKRLEGEFDEVFVCRPAQSGVLLDT